MPADTPPPAKTSYHLRGDSKYHVSPKKSLFPNFTHFCLFNMSSSRADSGRTKENFKKLREFFLRKGIENKNVSHVFHRCHEQGESRPSSRPFFLVFHFSVTVLILRELLRRARGEFGQTEGVFYPAHAHIQ
jgi:hypothetical protein